MPHRLRDGLLAEQVGIIRLPPLRAAPRASHGMLRTESDSVGGLSKTVTTLQRPMSLMCFFLRRTPRHVAPLSSTIRSVDKEYWGFWLFCIYHALRVPQILLRSVTVLSLWLLHRQLKVLRSLIMCHSSVSVRVILRDHFKLAPHVE